MALTNDKARDFVLGEHEDLPVVADGVIYEGSAVGRNASGLFRALVAGDAFAGFAQAKVDNTGGAAGAVRVRVRTRGRVIVPVAGVTGVANEGATVYASDDDTFTLTATGNTPIGKITRHISGTTVEVYFESAAFRSL